MSEPTRASIFRRIVSFETVSKENRDKNIKYSKDLCKDIFEIIKNCLIVATIQAAAQSTSSIFLDVFSKLIFFALLVYSATILMERSSLGIAYNAKGFLKFIAIIMIMVIMLTSFQAYLVSTIRDLVIIGAKCKI